MIILVLTFIGCSHIKINDNEFTISESDSILFYNEEAQINGESWFLWLLGKDMGKDYQKYIEHKNNFSYESESPLLSGEEEAESDKYDRCNDLKLSVESYGAVYSSACPNEFSMGYSYQDGALYFNSCEKSYDKPEDNQDTFLYSESAFLELGYWYHSKEHDEILEGIYVEIIETKENTVEVEITTEQSRTKLNILKCKI
jgi:hypothetical protein